jgi:hypothetical protein
MIQNIFHAGLEVAPSAIVDKLYLAPPPNWIIRLPKITTASSVPG